MTSAALDIDRPAQRQSRTELTLSRIGERWAVQPSGRLYTQALVDFLRARANRHTLRSYSYAILEFFGWCERQTGYIPTPERVRRAEAVQYERWLRERRVGLGQWRLQIDPERRLDAAIHELLSSRPGLNVLEIARLLPGGVAGAIAEQGLLSKRLACLVEVKTLSRSPSIDQIRRGQVDVGMAPALARRVGLGVQVPDHVFRYYVPECRLVAAERSSSIAARLAALSSFWRHLMGTGENVGPSAPLIRLNVWDELLRQALRQAPSHQSASRAAKTPGLSLFERLLATTYYRSLGVQDGLQMAAAQMRPSAVAEPARKPGKERFSDLRDRAMMLLLGQTGLRAEELQSLKRSSISGSPPMLDVVGKGGRRRRLVVPPATMAALVALERKLGQMAAHQSRYGSGRARAQALLGSAAPLLPTIAEWGRNSGRSGSEGITRQGLAMMLRRRALAAGLSPKDPEFARVHPHGLRHLFAKAAIASGTPVNVVQAIMGHQSGAQTLRYMQEHEPSSLIAAGFARAPSRAEPALPPELGPLPAEPLPPIAVIEERPLPPPAPPGPAAAPRLRPVRAPIAAARPLPPPRLAPAAAEPKLVAVGEAPAAELPPEPAEPEPSAAAERLKAIYARSWGERGNRSRLGLTTIPVAREIESLALGGELEQILGIESTAPEQGAEKLVHSYAGKASGLIWWSGPMGTLKPEMPVMSPEQVGQCGEQHRDQVCLGLVAIWQSWASGAGRGPTAAAALVRWVAEAIAVAGQVGQEVADRGGRWVPFDAPWQATSFSSGPRLVFREHEPAAILAWFEQSCWQYRSSISRDRKIAGEPLSPPPYYQHPDPLASMPEPERAELIDWILALTGGQPIDQSPRFEGASRATVARFVQALCSYDQQRDQLGELKAEARRGQDTSYEQQAIETQMRTLAAEADRLALVMGMAQQRPFDLAAEVAERVGERRAGEQPRQRRAEFYGRLVRRLFGEQAARDDAIRLVCSCGKTPLGQDRWRQLFAVDRAAMTISHSPEYAREFAKHTGAHSECVARRLARDLWELRKEHVSGQRQRLLERPDELLDAVEAMAAFKVPCPAEQEHELAARLGTQRPLQLYQAWERSMAAPALGRSLASKEIESELAELGERYSGAIAGEFVGQVFKNAPSPNASQLAVAYALLPSPVELVMAVLYR